MHIAICDDNIYAVSKLEALVDQAFERHSIRYGCESFDSGDTLLTYLDSHPRHFHLYLLDIEMPGTDGLDTARIIRQQDSEALIVFTTSHTELMSEVFGVYAFHFLSKPFNDDTAKGILLKAAEVFEQRQALFHFKVGKSHCTVYRSQITCIESYGRKLTLHTASREIHEYYGTLKGALEQLGGIAFVQAHSSYVVNIEQLARVTADTLLLRDGLTIPIGKKYHQAFHSAYRHYVLSHSI